MKLRTSDKMVPNLFYSVTEQNEINPPQLKHKKQLFKQCCNEGALKANRKKDRRRRGPKLFLEQTELSQKRQSENQNKQNYETSSFPQFPTQQSHSINHANMEIKQKPQLILDLNCQDGVEVEKHQEEQKQQASQNVPQSKNNVKQSSLNFNRLYLLDWASDNEDEQMNEIQVEVPFQEYKIVAKKEIEIQSQNQINTRDKLFRLIPQKKIIKCKIRREKKNAEGITEYNVSYQHNLQHVLTVKKEGIWKYSFYLRQNHSRPLFFYEKVASLSSTFFGNNYTLIKNHQKYSILTVSYQTNLFGFNGPRKMQIYTPKTVVPYEYLNECVQNNEWHDHLNKYVNKQAQWDEQAKSYTLNFRGRALKSSIKNFVITDEKQGDNYFIIFAKADDQLYNLDVSYPFSLIQGIAVAISSFQRKLTCD